MEELHANKSRSTLLTILHDNVSPEHTKVSSQGLQKCALGKRCSRQTSLAGAGSQTDAFSLLLLFSSQSLALLPLSSIGVSGS